MFGGLEEFDNSVESFTMKPNAKRLILKPKTFNNSPPIGQNSKSLNIHNTSVNSTTNQSTNNEQTSNNNNNKSADAGESFRNQIPTTSAQLSDNNNIRRVSWLHSNALEKVSKQNRASDFLPDNTIKELVNEKEIRNDSGQRSPQNIIDKSATMLNDSIVSMPLKSSRINAQTSNESLLSTTQSFLDESNIDLTINNEPNPAGVILRRAK